ncbi:MAG: LysM peptidoglycan-binding domain-containing protein [Candidatus Krumholzibacteriia bacterium]
MRTELTSSRWRLIAVLSILAFGAGTGCSTLTGRDATAVGTGPSPSPRRDGHPVGEPAVGLLPVDSPETVTPGIPPEEGSAAAGTGPAGESTFQEGAHRDWDDLFLQALAHLADGDLDTAEDLSHVLNHQARQAAGAARDSGGSAGETSSLLRRTQLLQALLVEQAAARANGQKADTLLSVGYAELRAAGLPDSLVPASGSRLDGITADLLKWDNGEVARWMDYFTGNGRRHFAYWLQQKAALEPLITSILVSEGLPRQLIYLAMIESGITPDAVSSVRAVGPWQFMQGTAKAQGLNINWWVDERRDFELSTRAAAAYLKNLHGQFGDWSLVLAAYNSGENRIARKIRQHGHDDFWSLRLPAQTTDFVPKFIAAARIGENPEDYGFEIPPVSEHAYDTIEVDRPTDLALIARCAGVPTSVVTELNPSLLRGATPPDLGPYPVRVPRGAGARTSKALAKVPADQRLTWSHHRVSRGETLGQIARRYGTSVADLSRLNKLSDVHLIRPGDSLLIPMPAELADRARKTAEEKGHYVPPDGYVRTAYTVKAGDTLGVIARRLGVTLSHLRKVNNLHGTSLIKPGQKLFAYRPGS